MSRKTIRFDINPLLAGPSLEQRGRSGSPYREIPVSDIDVDPGQPRRLFEPETLAELASSIKEYGVLCPILVRVGDGGTYRLVSGERRLRASRLVGLETIPAVVDSSEDEGSTSLAKQLVENIQRQDLNSMERALAIGQLRDQYAVSIREIARKLGISKGSVQRSVDILGLPDDLQAALLNGASESKVLLLASVQDRELRKELLSRLEDFTREALDAELAKMSEGDGSKVYHGGTARKRKSAEVTPEDERILRELQQSLGTKVQLVRPDPQGQQGRLTIEFYSQEELQELFQRLTVGHHA